MEKLSSGNGISGNLQKYRRIKSGKNDYVLQNFFKVSEIVLKSNNEKRRATNNSTPFFLIIN